MATVESNHAEIQRLLNRVFATEKVIEALQEALTNVASIDQLRQILLIKQTDIDELTSRITALEGRVTALESITYS